jgi:micrococcal nuclease
VADSFRFVVKAALAVAVGILVGSWLSSVDDTGEHRVLVTPSTTTLPAELDRIPGAEGGEWLVVDVIDGDTLKVQSGSTIERVRLLGINTPETHGPDECYGREATEAMTRFNGRIVTLYSDDSQDERDRYGRLLAYVFDVEGRNASLWAIQNGLGAEATYDGNYAYREQFRAAEADAQAALRGMWGACDTWAA